MNKEIILFEKKQDCCGCGVCANSCPYRAIEMQPDEYGFIYPVIDTEKCVGCGLCKAVCGFQKENHHPSPISAYAMQAKDDSLLEKSASGGVFAVLAKEILVRGGAVAGCAIARIDGRMMPRHLIIESMEELPKLQGSKYAQSYMGDIYCRVKELLASGRQVLFSGTPCQVDGLNNFLRGKNTANLFTVDLICHGVPSAQLLADYLTVLEKKCKGTLVHFTFRDKSAGWGYNGKAKMQYSDNRGKLQESTFRLGDSSFYKLFQVSELSRESCYHCKYACLHRPGDLTIGDFWGIEHQHPEALSANGGVLQMKKGISCVMVNTEQGRALLKALASHARLVESRLDAISQENSHLYAPATKGVNRDKILKRYQKGGYPAVERWFYFYNFRRKVKKRIASVLRKIKH